MAQVIIQPQTSCNLKNLIKVAVENQLKVINFGIAKTNRKLRELEKESGMDSNYFYEEFQKGKLGDGFKFIRWAGEYETLERLQKDCNELQGVELCS
ncbi:hypothetical protein K8R14_01845 [bacterium]|nr:hypothetical protein [bacterium]